MSNLTAADVQLLINQALANYAPASAADNGWLLITAALVFFMQAGFAMLEAGCCRSKNLTNILLKNLLDTCVGAFWWWLIGFAFAFGDATNNPFIGSKYFALSGIPTATASYPFFFFEWSFSAASATIVSGAMAERTRFWTYLVITSVISGWIYPVVVHWVWCHNGWLTISKLPMNWDQLLFKTGMIDFAGSGVVHLIGGTAGFVGTFLLGPRIGRFEANREGKIEPIKGHSVVLQTLGAFILWFGWYGFNPGSTLKLSGGADGVAALAAINTTLASSVGSIVALITHFVLHRAWDLNAAVNGLLAGLVAVTAPCAVIEPWAAVVIGIVAGFVYLFASRLLVWLHIDDPVDAVPVHFFNGIWGLFSVGLFASRRRVADAFFPDRSTYIVKHYGLFMGGGGRRLAVQVIGILAIMTWVAFWSFLTMFPMKLMNQLRVSRPAELEGVDKSEHAAVAWPEFDPSGVANPLPPEVHPVSAEL